MKAEPDSHNIRGHEVGLWPFSRVAKAKVAPFFGVRNPQARNFLRDSFKVGDKVFYYHSSTKVPGVYGICRVSRAAYGDDDALDSAGPFFDDKHTAAAPRWFKVDLEALDGASEGLARAPVTLAEMREDGPLAEIDGGMVLLRQPRLSVQPVTPAQWGRVLEISRAAGSPEEAQAQPAKAAKAAKKARKE